MEKVFKTNPLISVVVPVYKVEGYINRCVDSIINQTYNNLEIILVDDGSPDKCGKICDEYAKKDKRIKVIHKLNGGLSDARNAGIKIANGKYISFVDSDDYVEIDYIEVLYNALNNNNSDMSIGSHIVRYETGKIIDKSKNYEYTTCPRDILEKILYDEDVDLSAWSKLYKIELFDNVLFPKGRLYEDAATTYKLIDKCKYITICSKTIYNYMIRKDSITNNSFSIKKMDLILSTKEMCDYIANKYPELESGCNRRLMYAYLSTLSQLTKSKKRNKNIEKELMEYIKFNYKKVIKDKRTPNRDKIGLFATKFGFLFYKIIWNIYYKISGRI